MGVHVHAAEVHLPNWPSYLSLGNRLTADRKLKEIHGALVIHESEEGGHSWQLMASFC
jgi:hypothetical protein